MFERIGILSASMQKKVFRLNFTLKPCCGNELKIYSRTEPAVLTEREAHIRISISSFIILNTRSNSPL